MFQVEDVKSKKPSPLTFDYKLFEGKYAPDIVLTKSLGQSASGSSSVFTKATKQIVLYDLVEVSNSL